MDRFFENHIIIETGREITIEEEEALTECLKKVFPNKKWRYITDFEKGEWFTSNSNAPSKDGGA